MKKIVECLITLILIALIFILVYFISSDKRVEEDNNESDNTSEVEEQIEYTEKEQEIVDLIYNQGKILDYFDKDNFKSFRIIKIFNKGYFESKKNIRYLQVNYEFECLDGTINCNKLLNLDPNHHYNEEDNFFSFPIELDSNDREYIAFSPGGVKYIWSDWTQDNSSVDDFPVYE